MLALSITGWSPTLVKLAMVLSAAAYPDDFSHFNGAILYANRNCDFEQPGFYIYFLDSALWIVNRRSANVFDFLTSAEFNQMTTASGTFHSTIYHAALYVLKTARSYIEAFDDTIYFTGNSYGGTVAPLLDVIISTDYPTKDVNAIGFAPLPHMDDTTSALHEEKIASLLNGVDIVPTLSVLNL
jgi:hypothetical protein